MDVIQAHTIEQAIEQHMTVHAVRVCMADDGSIDKVHVMVAPGRAPKKVVRDIETLLVLKFDIHLDYRKISLVQARPEDLMPFLRPRLRLTAIDKRSSEHGHRITISLAGNNTSYLGVAEGPSCEVAHMLAARATVDALQPVVPEVQISVAGLEPVNIQGQAVLLASLIVSDGETEEKLLGSCYVGSDGTSAAARATLDALNRRFFSG